jgi:hypothetical protein
MIVRGNSISVVRLCRALIRKAGRGLIWLSLRGTDQSSLAGDRDIEWSWVAARLERGPGHVLDFGPGGSSLGLIAARRGYDVTAIDQQAIHWPYVWPSLRFVQGDILNIALPSASFDVIINCSSIEHVGLAGRYGSADHADGDFVAMRRLHSLCKVGGVMLLTVPIGRDATFAPLHRVYGAKRLPQLLQGWSEESAEFWLKNELTGQWQIVERRDALECSSGMLHYALGCFVLRRDVDRIGGEGP